MICCKQCGTPNDAPEYHEKLHDLHRRRMSGVQYNHSLSFSGNMYEDAADYPDAEGKSWIVRAMEQNMAERGLCAECGLPDLRGLTAEDFYTEEDAREMAECAAEQRAEMLAGC